jgi:glycosyl transferase family 25
MQTAEHPNMDVFVINLDAERDRWKHCQSAFAAQGFSVRRVSAMDGAWLDQRFAGLPVSGFARYHGRVVNPREIGCYASHLRAMSIFLQTPATHGLIAEDDVTPVADLKTVIDQALHYAGTWNVLRLSGLSTGKAVGVKHLVGPYRLCVNLGRMKGAGAYVIDRAAAARFIRGLRSMKMPFDHAYDREWVYGLRCASVQPFPVDQRSAGFRTTIQIGHHKKLSKRERWTRTYPYQMVNEISRWLYRSAQLVSLIIAARKHRSFAECQSLRS